MQRTAKQKQQKQAEQSDSWPSHKPQRRNLVPPDFLNKNNQELRVLGYVLTVTRSWFVSHDGGTFTGGGVVVPKQRTRRSTLLVARTVRAS